MILVWKKAATLIETVGGACGLLKWSFPVGMLEQVGRGGDAVWLKGRRGEEVLWRFARASWVVCFRPAGPPSTLLLSSSHSGFIRCWETKTDTFFSVKKLGKKKKTLHDLLTEKRKKKLNLRVENDVLFTGLTEDSNPGDRLC